MIDRIVHHLREHGISFRLSSQPAPESLPAVAYSAPPGGLVVDTQILVVGGQPAVACVPKGSKVNLPALLHELGAEVIAGSPADLPPPFTNANEPIPPVGSAMGILTIVDVRVSNMGAVVFTAFSPCDCFEIPFDELARLERPRIADFAVGGELPETGADEQGKKAA